MTPDQTEALKPCPFCNGEVRFVRSHVECEGGHIEHIRIGHCSVQFSCLGSDENEALIKEWNTRAPAIERDAEVAAMRETLEGISRADYRQWDEGYNTPKEFVSWAKSRANHALASTAGTDFAERLRKAEEERDAATQELTRLKKAIEDKGGNEHAPTQWAYDQACAAIEKHKANLTAAESDRDALAKAIQDAPHETECSIITRRVFVGDQWVPCKCDCWKASALGAMGDGK